MRDREIEELRAEIERLHTHEEGRYIEVANLQAKVERLRAKINPLVMFSRWAISDGPWAAINLDGLDVQERAEALGLITKTKYDPAIHGESSEAEPGNDWYVFTDLAAAEPQP